MVGTVVIKRVFNNNVAMVTSDDGSELIVIGLPQTGQRGINSSGMLVPSPMASIIFSTGFIASHVRSQHCLEHWKKR